MKRLAVFDFETDPFKHGRKPEPFACGFYDGSAYFEFWDEPAPGLDPGEDVIKKIIDHIKSISLPTIIYAHNGGKFDFIYLLRHLTGTMKIVNTRILSAVLGCCELRDSWGIIPEPLRRVGSKLDIDYAKMERETREDNKAEILRYMKQDCLTLYELVEKFHIEFGNRLTIGGTAMKEIKKRHQFEQATERFDVDFRPFYFGGRCQVLEPGIHHGKFICVDINSAYAYAMANIEHPLGTTFIEGRVINSRTDFATIRARNYGCLPVKTKTGISFDCEYGVFNATRHEIEAGEDTGTLEVLECLKTFAFAKRGNFADFINHFQSKKVDAETADNKILRDFYKRVNNSGYGKFAQNATDFKDYCISHIDDPTPNDEAENEFRLFGSSGSESFVSWQPSATAGDYIIWEKPSKFKTYYNVATAASITGATRAILLRGMADSVRPMYVDTDSIICEAFHGDIHETRLGAWKVEKLGLEEYNHKKAFDTADMVAIAGKKMYSMFVANEPVKLASKGARLKGADILKIAKGEIIVHRNDAPTFKLDGRAEFITRRIRGTAVAGRFGK